MTYPSYGPNDRGPGERWSFNLPLAIGVVFVFLVGVVAWVIASSGDDDGDTLAEASATSTSVAMDTTTTTAVAPPVTASPIPIPTITIITVPSTTTLVPVATVPVTVPITIPVTTPITVPVTQPSEPPVTDTPESTTTTVAVPPTLAPVTATTAPGASENAVPGDLAVPGHPMSKPPCDDKTITVVASAIGDQATAASIGAVLEQYDAEYLRTDQTCPSLTQSSDGKPIYVVYLGPFGSDTAACQARSQGPQGSYVRRLSSTLGPDHFVACS
jgi:hypothetical protein